MKLRKILNTVLAGIILFGVYGCADVPPEDTVPPSITDGTVTTVIPDTTDTPVTEEPKTDEPATDAPITDAPVTDAPVTDEPPVTEPVYVPNPQFVTVVPESDGNPFDAKTYHLDEYEHFRYENRNLEEMGANIQYNVDAEGNIEGIYSFRILDRELISKDFYRYSFSVKGDHLYTPVTLISHIKDITNVTGRVIRNVTFTDDSALFWEVDDVSRFDTLACNYFVREENENYVSVDGVIFTKDKKTLVLFPPMRGGHYDIPEGTETVHANAFCGSRIESLGFPTTLKSVGDALARAQALSVIYFPDVEKQAEIGSLGVSNDDVRKALHVGIVAVYSGKNTEDPAFKTEGICKVTDKLGRFTDITENDGVLTVGEGIRSILELDLDALSEKTYKKIVLPASISSFAGAYRLNTEAFEFAEDHSRYFTYDGVVYAYYYAATPTFKSFVVAYPRLRSGELPVDGSAYLLPSALRGSMVSSVSLPHSSTVQAYALDDCMEIEYFFCSSYLYGEIFFETRHGHEIEFVHEVPGKGNYPNFDSHFWFVYGDGTREIPRFTLQGYSGPK